jgi:hypothetical protein
MAGSPISPWVALEEGELLVVPKLSALSPGLRFESEIMNLLRGTDSELIPRTPV